jgi:hypothetical protein
MSDYIVSQTNAVQAITVVNETTTLVSKNEITTSITSSTQGPQGIQGPQGTLNTDVPIPLIPLLFSKLSSSEYISTSVGVQTLDSFSYTQFGAAKYIIYASQGLNRQVCELLLVQDGINIFSVEYANIMTSLSLGSFGTGISSGNIILTVDCPLSGITYRVMRTLLYN